MLSAAVLSAAGPSLSRSAVAAYDVQAGTSSLVAAPQLAEPGGVKAQYVSGFAGQGAGGRLEADAGETGLDLLPDSVFGNDDRVRVKKTTDFPWRAVAKLEMTFPSGNTFMGSGAIIGQFHILTAGHCVYDAEEGGWATEMRVWMGQNGSRRPYGGAWATYFRTNTGWTDYADPEYDWALVTLDRRVGKKTGWLGYGYNSNDAYFAGRKVTSAGYPGDRDYGANMYRVSGPVDHASTMQLFYNGTMDTYGGQSGSGVWVYTKSHGRVVYGIHAYGGSDYNKATRITQERFESINRWKKADNNQQSPTDRADLTDYDGWFGTSHSQISTALARAGDAFKASAEVLNNGTARAGAFQVAFYVSTDEVISKSDRFLGSVNVRSLPEFASTTATWSGQLPKDLSPGTYYVGWVIDSAGKQAEFSEDDNTGFAPRRLTITGSSHVAGVTEAVALASNDSGLLSAIAEAALRSDDTAAGPAVLDKRPTPVVDWSFRQYEGSRAAVLDNRAGASSSLRPTPGPLAAKAVGPTDWLDAIFAEFGDDSSPGSRFAALSKLELLPA
jgi:V8-like Glu-specific endopeptidase